MAQVKSQKNKIMPFFKYLTFIMVVLTMVTLGLFKFIDILPGEYFLILGIILGMIVFFIARLVLTRRGVKKRMLGTVLSILYVAILMLGIVYELNTIDFLKKLGFNNYKTENYSVLVLANGNYKSIRDLEGKKLGCMDLGTDGYKMAEDKLKKKVSVEFVNYDDVERLKNKFVERENDGLLIENSMLDMIQEDDEEFASKYKVIYDLAIDIETKDISKNVDIIKEPFSVYISGIDTYGKISSVSRSDVNMVISVNPKTHKVLITSIPRDYYVELAGKKEKDKLTHAGIYGADMSAQTIEKLLDIKINYYIKVNFSSLIDIVEALDGVNVYSKYDFISRDGFKYKSGYNSLRGDAALSFVRERKAFGGGDRVRIENQAAMAHALIDRVLSPSILVKYNTLLKTLGNSFVTNFNMEAVTDFIKMQIDERYKWEIEDISLNGSDSYEYTYSYKGAKSYVMMPDMETVDKAKEKLKEILNK